MKKKFSQRSSTTQATKRGREREMGDVTDEDRMRLREDLQFARALHSLAEKEVDKTFKTFLDESQSEKMLRKMRIEIRYASE